MYVSVGLLPVYGVSCWIQAALEAARQNVKLSKAKDIEDEIASLVKSSG